MSSTFRFVWDGNVLLHETFKKDNSEHTELTTWVFEGFVPTAKLVNGKAYSIISDHLGTPILAVDSEGNEVWNRQLDIYGRVRKEYKHSSLGDDVRPFIPFLYQGQYYDFETKLAYNRFRYYNPETGAYISQDPIRLLGSNPNLYAYVANNNWWLDIFGLDCENNDIKKVPLDHDLAQVAQNFRKSNPKLGKTRRNVAVVEIEDNKGKRTISAFSDPITGKHSEQVLVETIKDNNIPMDNVTRIYSELDYCPECKQMINDNLKNLKEQTYTFERKTEYNNIFRDYVDIW